MATEPNTQLIIVIIAFIGITLILGLWIYSAIDKLFDDVSEEIKFYHELQINEIKKAILLNKIKPLPVKVSQQSTKKRAPKNTARKK